MCKTYAYVPDMNKLHLGNRHICSDCFEKYSTEGCSCLFDHSPLTAFQISLFNFYEVSSKLLEHVCTQDADGFSVISSWLQVPMIPDIESDI